MVLKCVACEIVLNDEDDDLYFLKCEFCPLAMCNECGLIKFYEYFADYDSYADLCKECYKPFSIVTKMDKKKKKKNRKR